MLELIVFGISVLGIFAVIELHDTYGDANAHADEARATRAS